MTDTTKEVPLTTGTEKNSQNKLAQTSVAEVTNNVKVVEQNPYGKTPVTDIWGTQSTKDTLPSGAGKGPDTFIIDCRPFGLGRCTLGVLPSGTTIAHTALISWSATGIAGDEGPQDPALWAAQTGNQVEPLGIKDNYAHITLSQGTGTAEDVYAYLSGRNNP